MKFVSQKKDMSIIGRILRIFYRIIVFFLKPKNKKIQKIKKLGIDYFVFINEHIGFRMLFPGMHEANEIKILDNLIDSIDKNKNIIFIDVGANFGLFSLYFGKKLSYRGQIFSFEPDKDCCDLIKKGIEINQVKNISINNLAVSDKIGFTKMNSIDDQPSYQTSIAYVSDVKIKSDETNKTSVTTLDKFFENTNSELDVVKIDVEGHEGSVINGFKLCLANNEISPKIMMIELVDDHLLRFGHNREELINYICEFEYEAYINYRGKKLIKYSSLYNKIYNIFFIKKNFSSNISKLYKDKIFQ